MVFGSKKLGKKWGPKMFEMSGNNLVLKNVRLKDTSLAAKGALAHRLQRRTACKIKMAAKGAKNVRRGLERCLPIGFWAFPSTFAK